MVVKANQAVAFTYAIGQTRGVLPLRLSDNQKLKAILHECVGDFAVIDTDW